MATPRNASAPINPSAMVQLKLNPDELNQTLETILNALDREGLQPQNTISVNLNEMIKLDINFEELLDKLESYDRRLSALEARSRTQSDTSGGK